MSFHSDSEKVIAEARSLIFRFFFKVVVPVAILCALVGGGCYLVGVATGVFKRVVNPDAVISNYEWYEQQAKDIKAVEGQIRDAEDSVKRFKEDNGKPKDWTFDQREEYARLNSHVTGLKQARRGMVAAYNARSNMVTRNLWKHPSLPHQIEE